MPRGRVATLHRLEATDWDFADSKTVYLNHGIHPYPCKFIPQIPNLLIQELSSVGETVLDPFCGSGTTLVEALRLGRSAIGVDANPLAALISRVKTTPLDKDETAALETLRDRVILLSDRVAPDQLSMFQDEEDAGKALTELVPSAEDRKWITEWFDSVVVEELRLLRSSCDRLPTVAARNAALVALSAIIVGVSRQDSDTRYARVAKTIRPGDTCRRFARSLDAVISRNAEFAAEAVPHATCSVHAQDVLEKPETGVFDLVVSSPPYPNAYSYHLYHRSRMLWMGMDPERFKQVEIGSHRKYSSKARAAATSDTFREEFRTVLEWIGSLLGRDRFACFLVGDSTIRGVRVRNDALIASLAEETGFRVDLNLTRRLLDTKKAFNPSIGSIKTEHIVVMRNLRGRS